MRGYFGIGAERISKPMNLGAILRTGHAFGASFAFTIFEHPRVTQIHKSDTSKVSENLPTYAWPTLDEMQLPAGCSLVGVELTEDSIDLPSFRHPTKAAYLFGPEKGEMSQPAQQACEFIVKIPTKFCVNVSVAAAIVMYDRMRSMGSYPARPVMPGGPPPVEKWTQVPRKGGVR